MPRRELACLAPMDKSMNNREFDVSPLSGCAFGRLSRCLTPLRLLTAALALWAVMATAAGPARAADLGPITAADLAEARALPQWRAATWTNHPVRVELRDREELARLLRTVPLADFSREDVKVTRGGIEGTTGSVALETRVTDAEQAALEAAGWRPVALRDAEREGREAIEKVWAARDAGTAAGADKAFTFPLTVFPTHAQIGQILADFAAAHPTRARTFQYGTSVQGRALWGLVISDDVNNTEAEPEVRLSSSMHGDEVTGMVLLLDFANYLLSNYGVAGREDVTNLVDNYEIHITPSYNPDGTYLVQRYNANAVDLNRNFPLPAGTDPVTETENLAFMAYANAHHFTISENYHGGALVVNYLWDYTPTLTADDAALRKLSLEYSTYNTPMYNGAFTQGITNGYAWYIALGTLQDWSYDQTGCIDETIEVSTTKWPATGTLTTFWNDNRESLMHFVKSARYGINGVVTDAGTGLPVAATVTVTGNSKAVVTDPAHGDYYKLLASGTYELTYSAPGYYPQTISGVATTWGTPTVRNVQLVARPRGDFTGTALAVGGTPLAAQVQAFLQPGGTLSATVTAGADGAFTVPALEYGSYRLVFSAPGHAPVQKTVTLDAATVGVPTVYLPFAVAVNAFATDFDGGATTGWTGTWALGTPGADGTTWAMTDSPSGNYTANLTRYCTMSAGADLSQLLSGTVSWRARWALETNYDGVQLQVSVGGGAWTPVATARTQAGSGSGVQTAGQPWYEGTQSTWVTESVDLAPWLGQANVRFQFVLRTDNSQHFDGYWFDQFAIAGEAAVPYSGAGGLPAATRLAGVQPNPFNPSTTVRFELATAGPARVRVYDLSGRLVRTLVDEARPAGAQAVAWDGLDAKGQPAASGVYLVRLEADGTVTSLKASLVK